MLVGLLVLGGAAAYAVTQLTDSHSAQTNDDNELPTKPKRQLAESVVQYAPGHRAAARAVSRRVAISRREPVTADSRALAPDATVIVIAGADKAP